MDGSQAIASTPAAKKGRNNVNKNYLTLFVCVALVVALGCSKPAPVVETETIAEPAAESTVETAEARHDVVYVCGCGPDCNCGSISTEPGNCDCGTALVWAHVVKVEGNDALLCTCAEGCDCTIDASDDTKCSCGNEVRRASLEGSGLWFCNCGGSCTCNHVSSEPGVCGCGMDLITS